MKHVKTLNLEKNQGNLLFITFGYRYISGIAVCLCVCGWRGAGGGQGGLGGVLCGGGLICNLKTNL